MADFFTEMLPHEGHGSDGSGEIWPADSTHEYYARAKWWLNAAFEEADSEQKQSEELKDMDKYIEYLAGKQWPSTRPAYKSKPCNNRTFRLFWELIGLLTDIKPIIQIKTTLPENAGAKRQEDILNNSLKAWWLNTDADLQLAMVVAWGLLTTGVCKLEWDESFNNGEGDLRMVPLSPKNVLLLKPENSLQSSQAVIYKTVKPVGWVKRRYPTRAAFVRPDPRYSKYSVNTDVPSTLPSMQYQMLSPAMKRIVGADPTSSNSAYPMCLYREFWLCDHSYNTSNRTLCIGDKDRNWAYEVRPGQLIYPRGRLIVMAGNEIMHDGPNPYWHGRFPFSMLRLNQVPWAVYALSDMRSITDLQDIMNQLLAGVIDIIKKILNPSFYAPNNALSENTWQSIDWSIPGARLRYSPAAAHEPKFAPQPTLPPQVLQFYTMIEREMDQQSGSSAILGQALQKKQVPGGDTLDTIKSTQQTPIRMKGRNIEIFLRDLGGMQVPNFFQFYTQKKRLSMLGSKGVSFEEFDWDPASMVPSGVRPEEHIKNFRFMIQPDSLLNIRRMEERVNVLKLRAMRDIDRRTMYKVLDVNLDVDQIEENLKKEAAQGTMPPPPKRPSGGKGLLTAGKA